MALVLPTNSSPVTVTFAGLALQGSLTNYAIAGGGAYTLISSMVPQAGGLQTVLKYVPVPNSGDNVEIWNPSALGHYYIYSYAGAGVGTGLGYQSDWTDGESFPPAPPSIPGDQTDTADGVYWAPEPVMNVGQGFFINATQTNSWIRQFPGCCGQ